MKQTAKETGNRGESVAVSYLRRRGYRILERNYRAGHHEIDIIARRWKTILFVEVKARTYKSDEIETAPPPGMAVRKDKKQFTRQAARQYLFEHYTTHQPRMDVIEVWFVLKNEKPRIHKIRHIKGAY